MEWIYFTFLLLWYKYRSGLYTLSYPLYSISFSFFSYFEKSFEKSNSILYCSYSIISSLLKQFGLIIEYGKSEILYFSRSCKYFNLLLLDLSPFEGQILTSKDIWKYLRFIFDRKLIFYCHIKHYANKTISTIKCIKMLGNFTIGLLLT